MGQVVMVRVLQLKDESSKGQTLCTGAHQAPHMNKCGNGFLEFSSVVNIHYVHKAEQGECTSGVQHTSTCGKSLDA
jgi:D-mannonate dehydratase